MHHQIYGFRRKIQDQQNSGAHFVMLSSAEEKKSAEILGKTIESAEVHYTKPEDEFRRTIGLNTKVRRTKRTAEVRYIHNLCSGVPLKNRKLKSAIFFAIGSGSQDLNFPPIFFQQISCPIIGRNGKKVHKVCRDLFSKQI